MSPTSTTDHESVWTLSWPKGTGGTRAWLISNVNAPNINEVLPFTGTYMIVLAGAAAANASYAFRATLTT